MAKNSVPVKAAVGVVKATSTAYTKKWSFLAVFAFIFILTTSAAASLDVLPNPPKPEAPAVAQAATPVAAVATPELPTKIEIPTINLSVSVSNPASTDVEILDNALLKGAVRYPSSSKLGEEGNVIIFGHSSYLPIVNNKNFKAFDGIQNLKNGDRITVSSEGHKFVYAVTDVRKANAASADSIPLTTTGHTLTLATCNSFGTKDGRFVVTATLVETDAL